MASRLLAVALVLACAYGCSASQIAGSTRKLLDVALTPMDPVNATYPNATVFVGLYNGDKQCSPWWEKTPAGGTQCPKACGIKFEPNADTAFQLSPLTIKVEKGAVSTIRPRPIKGAYLNATSDTVRKANPAEFRSISSNAGLIEISYSASGTTGNSFTASMGLIKKDPNANGAAVPAKVGTQAGQAKHIPYCFFNVTWQIVAPGSIKGIAPASAPLAAKKAAAPAPTMLATAAKKPPASAPAPAQAAATTAADDLQAGGF